MKSNLQTFNHFPKSTERARSRAFWSHCSLPFSPGDPGTPAGPGEPGCPGVPMTPISPLEPVARGKDHERQWQDREGSPQHGFGEAGIHTSVTWEPGKAGGALLPRKAGEPRLPRQAGETLGAFIAFGTRHVQTWESGEALLSFHSRGA